MDFQFIKINSFYSLRTQLRQKSLVSQVRLIFGSDSKSVHKVKVTLLIHKQKRSQKGGNFSTEANLDQKSSKDETDIILVQTFD